MIFLNCNLIPVFAHFIFSGFRMFSSYINYISELETFKYLKRHKKDELLYSSFLINSRMILNTRICYLLVRSNHLIVGTILMLTLRTDTLRGKELEKVYHYY